MLLHKYSLDDCILYYVDLFSDTGLRIIVVVAMEGGHVILVLLCTANEFLTFECDTLA
jgi:hypothetical protein